MPGTLRKFVGRSPRLDSTLRRFALALVVAFGLVGVVAFAQGLEEEETLAGPAITLEEDDDKGDPDAGGCPPNFPIEIHVKTESKVDVNGDHIICTDEEGRRFVDNDFLGDESGSSLVTGHGNFFDKGKVKLLQDISFSFHGKNTGASSKLFSDAAKGEFEYHDQTGDGPDLTVHGDVLCLTASGNTALLIGRVTRSNDKALPVDVVVAWMAEDNGEGINEPADRVSRLRPIGDLVPKACKAKFPELPLLRIESGNIQVH